MEQLKKFISNAIIVWILGIGGSVLTTLGISATSVTEIVTGVVAVVLAWIGHAIGLQIALNTPAPGQQIQGKY